jgi:hypothetical protein
MTHLIWYFHHPSLPICCCYYYHHHHHYQIMLPPGLSRCGLLPAPAVEVSANAKEVNSAACCLDGHSTKLSTDTPQLTLANKPKREQPIEDEAESDEKGQLQAMPSSLSECKRTTREPAIQADKQTEKRCEK